MAQGKQLKGDMQELKKNGFFNPKDLSPAWTTIERLLDILLAYPLKFIMMIAPIAHAVCY